MNKYKEKEKEHVYYIPVLDQIVIWNKFNEDEGLDVLIDVKNNVTKKYEVVYLGEL